jgi:hypothetical protein
MKLIHRPCEKYCTKLFSCETGMCISCIHFHIKVATLGNNTSSFDENISRLMDWKAHSGGGNVENEISPN